MAINIPRPSLDPQFYIDNRVYTDIQTYNLEMEKIFLKAWNFVCHDSEISKAGDYFTATVAGQPIVVCRDHKGRIRAFYNTCPHRAVQLVPEGVGNVKNFVCFYHLWSFGLDGKLAGLPEREAYETSYNPCGLNDQHIGLVPVCVDVVHRLVFVRIDEEGPDLKEFLGEAMDFFVQPFGDPDFCMKVERDQTVKANWKMQPENSRDGYHAPLLHKRLRFVSPPRPYRCLENGHTLQELDLDYERGLQNETVDEVLSKDPNLVRAFMKYPLPGMSKKRSSYVVTLFPDTLILVRFSTALIERQIPVHPGKTIIQFRSGQRISDNDEILKTREKHWYLYWDEFEGNLPEDVMAYEAQQRGVQSIGARYSLVARGEKAQEGMRGDDNRIRWFWEFWRNYMKLSVNAPPNAELLPNAPVPFSRASV